MSHSGGTILSVSCHCLLLCKFKGVNSAATAALVVNGPYPMDNRMPHSHFSGTLGCPFRNRGANFFSCHLATFFFGCIYGRSVQPFGTLAVAQRRLFAMPCSIHEFAENHVPFLIYFSSPNTKRKKKFAGFQNGVYSDVPCRFYF